MSVKAMLSEYISGLPDNHLFCTRDLLGLCDRRSLDVALSTLVKEAFIERLAWGVFRLRKPDNEPISPLVVAAVKLKAFGKCMFDLPEKRRSPSSKRLSLSDAESTSVTVGTNGKSSSFRFQGQKIVCLSLGPRKCRLGHGAIGAALRRLWLLGDSEQLSAHFQTLVEKLHSLTAANIQGFLKYLPDWLSRRLFFLFNQKLQPAK